MIEPIEKSGGLPRRYDVDFIRISALFLLIIYHSAISFQPWAKSINFIQNDELLGWIWIPMSMLNIWRIPILFVVSGMGARFAMERRGWLKFLIDRGVRIGIPLVFGIFAICPITHFILTKYYENETAYVPNAGHLWFLINILCYVSYFIGFYWAFVVYPENKIFSYLSRQLKRPWLLYLAVIPMIVEVLIVNPRYYSMFPTPHGHFVGSICFMLGFIFVCLKDSFWEAVQKLRWSSIIIAAILFFIRLKINDPGRISGTITAIESMCWMLSVFGFSSLYLNSKSKLMSYLSRAVFPIYIVHFPVQYLISYYLLPTGFSAGFKLLVLITGTLLISILLFEIIKRIRWIRPLFGMKLQY